MASKQKPYQVLKGANRSGVPGWVKALYVLLLAFTVVSVFLWVFMDFDLNNGWLAFIGVLAGIVIGYLSSAIIFKFIPGMKRLPVRGASELRTMYIGVLLSLTPFLLQKWNKGFGSSSPTCDPYQVLEKSKATRRTSSIRTITIIRNANPEKVNIDPSLHARIQPGDSLQICIATGALGFEYITGVSR